MLGKAERTELSGYKHVCLLPTQVDRIKALYTKDCLLIFFNLFFLTKAINEIQNYLDQEIPNYISGSLKVSGKMSYDHGR